MDYTLDPETRKKLVGLLPMGQGATTEYTPEIFSVLPEAARPVFIQRSFTQAERGRLRQAEEKYRAAAAPYIIKNGDTYQVKTDSQADVVAFNSLSQKRIIEQNELARLTVIGVKSLYCAATGTQIPFKASEDGGLDSEIFGGLCEEARQELFANAQKISSLLPQERLGLK